MADQKLIIFHKFKFLPFLAIILTTWSLTSGQTCPPNNVDGKQFNINCYIKQMTHTYINWTHFEVGWKK